MTTRSDSDKSAPPPGGGIGAFCAIDFETASYERSSACAVGIVRVEHGEITREWSTLIRPPGGYIHPRFTGIHGITESDVARAPKFPEVWRELSRILRKSSFVAAHNAPFDRSVFAAACKHYRLPVPRRRFVCTVGLSRQTWGIYPTKLPDVCRELGIELRNHHDSLSDALACAEIVRRAHNPDTAGGATRVVTA